MRVLLDECVPRKLANEITGHEVSTVPQERLKGTADNPLLAEAQAAFDVLVTVDRNLQFQANTAAQPLAVVVLHAQSNRLADLKPLVPELLQALNHIKPRQIVHVPQQAP